MHRFPKPLLRDIALAHGAASFVHFAHNATYLEDYPNLPATFTVLNVYLTWILLAAVGVTGFMIHKHRTNAIGLVILSIFGLSGFAGLLHYNQAPWSSHTSAMNVTILLESFTGVVMLAAVTTAFLARRKIARKAAA